MKLQVVENKLYNKNGDEVGVRLSCFNHSNNQMKIDNIMDSLEQYALDNYRDSVIIYSAFCSIVVMTETEKLDTKTLEIEGVEII